MPASVENLFPRNSAATSAGPSRPRTISAPHDSTVTSAGPNRPRTMRPLPDSTAASVRPKPTPSNKPASVENLFPRSSAATPCGTNRNLQQENHSNFTVASPHSPNTMAPGRHHDIRRDLPPSQVRPSSPLQIPDPHGSQLVGRACVYQVVADFSPTRIQPRKPAWSTVTNPLRGNLVPADHSAAPRGSTFTSQRIYHSSQLSHPRFHVPVLLVSHPMTDTPSHVFDQTGHGGRQTRIGRRVYCRCVQSVHGPNRAWGTGFVEILFTTQPSTISRGSIHGA